MVFPHLTGPAEAMAMAGQWSILGSLCGALSLWVQDQRSREAGGREQGEGARRRQNQAATLSSVLSYAYF